MMPQTDKCEENTNDDKDSLTTKSKCLLFIGFIKYIRIIFISTKGRTQDFSRGGKFLTPSILYSNSN